MTIDELKAAYDRYMAELALWTEDRKRSWETGTQRVSAESRRAVQESMDRRG